MPISIPSSIKGISTQGISKGPLEVLYGISTNKEILSYPRDLNTNPAKQHVIQFSIMEKVPPTNSGTTIRDGIESVTQISSTASGNVVETVKETINDPKAAVETVKNKLTLDNGVSVANKIGAIGDATLQKVGNFVNSQLTSKAVSRWPSKTINLYIPDGLNTGYAAAYDSSSGLTQALGKPYFFAQMAPSVAEAAKKGTNIGVNDISGNPFLRQLAAEFAGKALGSSGDLVTPALAAEGYAVNPQLQVLFTGIGFRQFRFEFTLTPYSQEEAETIKKIVSWFKWASAPTIQKSKYFDQGMFYEVPDPVRLEFLFAGKPNLNIPRIEECVIRNVDVQYSPMGWATFGDGNPVQTKMTLELEETVLIDKNKIREGY